MIVGKKQGDALLDAKELYVLFWTNIEGELRDDFAKRVAREHWPKLEGSACVPGALLGPCFRIRERFFHAGAIYSVDERTPFDPTWTAQAVKRLETYVGKNEECAFVRFPAGAPTRELIQILHQSRIHFVAYT